MKNERIGNDINIAWKIKSGDSPFPLEGKNVTLYLHHPYGKQKVEDFRLEGNKVIWTFKGADQKYVGKHGLTLVVNEGANGMITTDSCDFVNLVSCSCQVGGQDNDGVQTEAIELTSTLGFIAYDDTEIREELSRLDTDKADKSEIPTKLSDLEQDIEIRYDDTEIVNKLEDLENTKVDEARVAQLIALEHVYFRYMESENKIYSKGYNSEEWILLDSNTFFAIIGKPLPVHMGVIGDVSGFNVSTNDFEIVTSVNGNSLTWIYNGKKYTFTFAYGEQIITSEPYEAGSSYDDTEIRQELTELSAEVSGLSDKIDNLPTAGSDVFKAEYGVTTYAEVAEAYAQGKVIHCDYQDRCYILASFTGTTAWFVSVVTTTINMLFLEEKGWNRAIYYAENTGNKVTTIDANSTDAKYPSAKAVYDFVNNTLGTIINGDY